MSLLVLGAVAVTVGLLGTLGSYSEFSPLVPKSGWTVTGQFPLFPIPASPLEVPSHALASADLVLWRSRSQEAQGTQGTVTSAPFISPRYLAVPYLVFPVGFLLVAVASLRLEPASGQSSHLRRL